jgi:hypothetical protein
VANDERINLKSEFALPTGEAVSILRDLILRLG